MVVSGKLKMVKAEIARLLEFLAWNSYKVTSATIYWSKELRRPGQILAGEIDAK